MAEAGFEKLNIEDVVTCAVFGLIRELVLKGGETKVVLRPGGEEVFVEPVGAVLGVFLEIEDGLDRISKFLADNIS